MLQRLAAQFPAWMRPSHPMLRYLLERPRENTRSARFGRAFFISMIVWLFAVGGYGVVSNVFSEDPFSQPLTTRVLMEFLYWPTFILQVMLQITVFLLTVNTIGEEKRRQHWDSLRATSEGAALAMRTRWSAVVFYRMRSLLGVLILVRLILIVGILYDLTAFRGEYLHNLTGSITPQMPVEAGVVLLAFAMAASLLLPFTSLGVDTAFGLLISTVVRHRTYGTLVQIGLIALRMVIVGILLFIALQFRQDMLEASDWVIWVALLAFAAVGDWGLSLLYLGYFGQQVWADVSYGIFLGVGMLVVVMFQALLTDGLMALTVWRAERSE